MSLLRRRHVFGLIAACTVTACVATDDRVVGVVFDRDADTAKIDDEISGAESVMYRFQANDGQLLSVSMASSSRDAAFIVYAPGEWPGDVLFDSAANGSREYRGMVNSDGVYAVQVFQRQEASDQINRSSYSMVIRLMDGGK